MNSMLAIFNLGGGEVFLILAVVLILFGAKKMPELARGLGLSIKEFKKATREVTDELHSAMDETNRPAPIPAPRLPAATVASGTDHKPDATPAQKA